MIAGRGLRAVDVEKVTLRPRCGADVTDVLIEAILLALAEDRRVEVTHNERRWVLDPGRIMAVVSEAAEVAP